MAGPKYEKPPVPMTPAYKEGGGWKVATPGDRLARGAVVGSVRRSHPERPGRAGGGRQPGPEGRRGALQARAAILFNRAALFPTISAGAGASSIKESTNQPFFLQGVSRGSSGDFLLSLDMSYEVDLWGRIRRSVAAARQEAQATAADLETAKLSLQAELVMAYFELRSADAQQRLLDETLKAFAASLELTKVRFEEGASPKSDVALAQTQLDTTRAQATGIGVQRAQLEHATAILIGTPPAAFSLPPDPAPLRPPVIPVGLPSELLERRPDIAGAERRVAEANEQIGIAQAAYYPTVMLNASVSDAARAAYDATVATYCQTTLTAFQQVEDNLAALRILTQEADEQHRAVESSQESLQLSTARYEGGRTATCRCSRPRRSP